MATKSFPVQLQENLTSHLFFGELTADSEFDRIMDGLSELNARVASVKAEIMLLRAQRVAAEKQTQSFIDDLASHDVSYADEDYDDDGIDFVSLDQVEGY